MALNIAEKFVAVAKSQGDRTAVIEAGTGHSLSFAELNSRSDSYAHYFAAKGLAPGDTTLLMVTPSTEFLCLALALFKLGTPIVLIDPGMGYRNLLRCIDRVEPRFLVGIPKAILFSKLFRNHFGTIREAFCCGRSFGLCGPDIRDEVGSSFSSEYRVYSPAKEDLAAIIFTTGSTGPPKGVRYEHSIFAAQLRLITEYYGIDERDVDQPAFPLFALFSAALGACSIIPDMDPTKPAKVDPTKFVKSIQQHQVSYSFGSPAIWNVVGTYCMDRGIVLKSLKKVLMAGAPVPYALIKTMAQILPEDAMVYTPYGATESLPIVSIEGREIVSETWADSQMGKGTCVGRPLPGIDIGIIETNDGIVTELTEEMLVEEGIKGEIIVRGDVVTRGYHNNQEETTLSKIKDGTTFWHRMGDLGYLDEKGRLWFCGRRAHRVVSDSKTYYSIPCEAIINEHPAVYRSALVGINDETAKGGQLPAIIIEPVKEKSFSDKVLLQEAQQLAARSELTRDIEYFLIHKDFPVDIRHNAKIFREKLAIWAQKKLFPHQ